MFGRRRRRGGRPGTIRETHPHQPAEPPWFSAMGRRARLFSSFGRGPAAAEEFLQRAYALNPEETGALLVLGELSLMRGQPAKAEERLKAVCQTNSKAVAGLFLRGYLAWERGYNSQARDLLQE